MADFVDVFPQIVKVRCHHTQMPKIEQWCFENNVEICFKNHWSDGNGTWTSYAITDERERFMFILRWG